MQYNSQECIQKSTLVQKFWLSGWRYRQYEYKYFSNIHQRSLASCRRCHSDHFCEKISRIIRTWNSFEQISNFATHMNMQNPRTAVYHFVLEKFFRWQKTLFKTVRLIWRYNSNNIVYFILELDFNGHLIRNLTIGWDKTCLFIWSFRENWINEPASK